MRLNDEESRVMVEFGVDDDDDEGFCSASFLKILRRRISSESVKTRPFGEVGEETGDVATCLRFLGVDDMVVAADFRFGFGKDYTLESIKESRRRRLALFGWWLYSVRFSFFVFTK